MIVLAEAESAEEQRWQAVLDRDAGMDGVFVFAVRSTGIYCRPSCPGRRPQRDRVTFYGTPAEAEAAGFRPCRRCRPHLPAEETAPGRHVRRARAWLDAHLDETPRLAELAAHVGISPYHLQRLFKRETGVTPRQYVTARRLERFKTEVRQGEGIAAALYGAGFGSSSRLSERAPAQLGMTPGSYRRGGRGVRIAYAFVACPLGLCLVAATERGLCWLSFGDEEGPLEAALRREYPAAALMQDAAAMGPWTGAVADIFATQGNGKTAPSVPLDIPGSPFQQRVWQALQAIPPGETRTYSEIARSLGNAKGMRAVARACATNPVSLVIPCHRVVREDGGLGGYRWGLERKQALLDREKPNRGGRSDAAPAATPEPER
jgi:AraC family transcriptional regulator of adaptative response/methylated-DNA-[protein]-cysteine methyltransferase